jgi:hypothetical protein
MRGTLLVCCALTTAPPKANMRAIAKIPTNFRFSILDFRLSDRNQGVPVREILVMVLVSLIENRQSKIKNHLISLFALASTSGGIVRPICLAVFKFITNSNFVGCSTGSSAGFAPFKILST